MNIENIENIERRTFLKQGLTVIAGALAAPALLTLEGCPISSTTLADLTQTLGNAVANIAMLEGNPTLAAKITTDTTAAVTAIENWKSGSPVQLAVEALALLEDDLNLIPVLSQFTPWVDLAIGTIDAILAQLPTSAVAALRAGAGHRSSVGWRTPVLYHAAPHSSREFRSQWNELEKLNPSAGVPPLA